MVSAPCIGPQHKAVAQASGTMHFLFPALVHPQLEFRDFCLKGNMEKNWKDPTEGCHHGPASGVQMQKSEVEGAHFS